MTSTLTREPAHGTIIEYVSYNCRCKLCQDNWDRNAERFFYGKDGTSGRKVPTDAARSRVELMLDIGFEAAAIADAAGITRDTVRAIARGDQRQMQRRTADAILALDPSSPIPGHRVPFPIVRHMLNEMRVWGITLKWIYHTAGVSSKFKGNYAGSRCSWDNYVKLRRVYDVMRESGLLKEGEDGAAS